MTAPTLAERISRKASAIVGAGKPDPADPGALAKAEVVLQAARDALAKADRAHLAAVAEAATTGDGAKIRAARRELEAAQGDAEVAAQVYEACKRGHDASAAAGEHGKRLVALGRLQKCRYEIAAELDAWLEQGGKLYVERRRLDDEMVAMVPDGRYGALVALRDADALFREQLGLRQIPGGLHAIRSPEYHKTCSVFARETGAAALAALKAKAPK